MTIPSAGPRGVTVSTLDPESSDRGSNPREGSLVLLPTLCESLIAAAPNLVMQNVCRRLVSVVVLCRKWESKCSKIPWIRCDCGLRCTCHKHCREHTSWTIRYLFGAYAKRFRTTKNATALRREEFNKLEKPSSHFPTTFVDCDTQLLNFSRSTSTADATCNLFLVHVGTRHQNFTAIWLHWHTCRLHFTLNSSEYQAHQKIHKNAKWFQDINESPQRIRICPTFPLDCKWDCRLPIDFKVQTSLPMEFQHPIRTSF